MKKNRGFEKVSLEQWEKDRGASIEGDVSVESINLPSRGTSHSAGYDIFSPMSFSLAPMEEIKFPLGWKVYMLRDEFFLIVPRSGLGFKHHMKLANTVGIIDCDYFNNNENEGHCWIKIRNEGLRTVFIKRGDAIAQGIFQKYLLVDDDDYIGIKREGGLGSTNRR